MYNEIIRKTDNTIINKGDRFYLINQYGTFLKKISWLGEHNFEWLGGWCDVDSLELNPNKKSKVKFILNEENLQ